MQSRRVAIIGGGPGGLMTAHALERDLRCAHEITVYEASRRLGGKVLTRRFDLLPGTYEAGAAEFYDYSVVGPDPLRELVLDLGLSIVPMGGAAMLWDGKSLANSDDVSTVLGRDAMAALNLFDRLAHDAVSPRDFYRGGENIGLPNEHRFDFLLAQIGDPEARRYVEHFIHSDLATEPERTSIAYGLDNYLMNDPRYMGLYAIEGGNEQLITALAARIRGSIRLGSTVRQIARSVEGRLRVTGMEDAGRFEDEFDAVVIALPVEQLKRLEFCGSRLAAAMAGHVAHHDHPAHYLRVSVLFDSPFWRPKFKGSFLILDRFGGCCLYDESSRVPEANYSALGWLLGGSAAEELSLHSDEELLAAALDSLPAFFGYNGQPALEAHVNRWTGAVSAMPGGPALRHLDERHCPEPFEHSRLFLVGDYLFDSTLNGVLDSAEYVAGWIVDLFHSSAEAAL